MKKQSILSSKDKSKKLKCRLLQFVFGAFNGYADPNSIFSPSAVDSKC